MASWGWKVQRGGFGWPQEGSVGLAEQRPTPVTPSAGLLNSGKDRYDVKAENLSVSSLWDGCQRGQREPQRGGGGSRCCGAALTPGEGTRSLCPRVWTGGTDLF